MGVNAVDPIAAACGTICPSGQAQADCVVALMGNPNVGKSTVFNALTHLNQHTGNWPGKTVTGASGLARQGGRQFLLVDLPGTYSLLARSPEEEVARDFLLSQTADCAILVVDATCLERNLHLVLQVTELMPHAVLCLNLMDEARKKGTRIDLPALEQGLGIPVVPCTATRGAGLKRLMDTAWAVAQGETPTAPPPIRYPAALEDPALPEERKQDLRTASYVLRAEEIANDAIRTQASLVRDRRIDRVLTSRRYGIPVMLLLLAVVFFLTISGANLPSEWLSELLFACSMPLRRALAWIGAPVWMQEMLVDGVWNVLSSVVSVMLPPMAIFFPLFTLLEDVGYLPRVAFNLDHAFCRAHACGKQSLTLCMGFGCNAAGVIGCRIIDAPRERLIAILTNSLVPCNGRFPTIISLLTIFFIGTVHTGALRMLLSAAGLTLVIILGVLMTLVVSRLLSATVLRGLPSSFVLELPPYRRPQIGRVIVHSIFDRTLFVLGRAVLVAAPAGLVIWLMANLSWGGNSILAHCAGFLDPLGRMLGLDGMILLAFIIGFPANEIVMPLVLMGYLSSGSLVPLAGLSDLAVLLTANGWTAATALSFILFSLFHWPCSTTCLTIWRETGSLRWTACAMLLPTGIGFVLCTLVHLVSGLVLL